MPKKPIDAIEPSNVLGEANTDTVTVTESAPTETPNGATTPVPAQAKARTPAREARTTVKPGKGNQVKSTKGRGRPEVSDNEHSVPRTFTFYKEHLEMIEQTAVEMTIKAKKPVNSSKALRTILEKYREEFA